MDGDGLYVYAVVGEGIELPAGAGGVGDPPAVLRVIGTGRIAAVVSDAPARLRARRRDLLAHQDLLMDLADSGPVLPMRFGMVAPDEDALLAQLALAETSHLRHPEEPRRARRGQRQGPARTGLPRRRGGRGRRRTAVA
ncbi:hypothetical protein SBADM41S_11610 [Streptomyces badius]